MKQFLKQNLLILLLFSTLLGFSSLHALAMDGSMAGVQNCTSGPAQTSNCHQPVNSSCCTIEAGTAQGIALANEHQFSKILVATSSLAFGFSGVLALLLLFEAVEFAVFRSWHSLFYKWLLPIQQQIGSWLAKLQNQDHSRASLWLRNNFALQFSNA